MRWFHADFAHREMPYRRAGGSRRITRIANGLP